MMCEIVLAICGMFMIQWVAGLLWLAKPYKIGTWFFHDILGWHKPSDIRSFDGCSEHSQCEFCKKEIMQDSQGNWFTYD